MVVVGLSDRLPGLLAQLEGSQPDLLLLDWELADGSIEDLLTHLHSLEHQSRTMVLAARPEAKEAVLAAGADFFLCKDSPPDTLLPILRGMQQSEPEA